MHVKLHRTIFQSPVPLAPKIRSSWNLYKPPVKYILWNRKSYMLQKNFLNRFRHFPVIGKYIYIKIWRVENLRLLRSWLSNILKICYIKLIFIFTQNNIQFFTIKYNLKSLFRFVFTDRDYDLFCLFKLSIMSVITVESPN